MRDIRRIQVEIQRLNQKLAKIGHKSDLVDETNSKLETCKLDFKSKSKEILRGFSKKKKWDDFDWALKTLTEYDIASIGGYKTMYEMLYERQKDLSNLI